jgi:hypothetical protein
MIIGFRLVGWVVLVFGVFAFRYYLSAYMNPATKISVNHSLTADPDTKAVAALFSGVYLLFGAFFALTPRRILERLFRWHFEVGEKLFGRRNPLSDNDEI